MDPWATVQVWTQGPQCRYGPSRLVVVLLLSVFATIAQGADRHFIEAEVRTDVYLPCEAPEGSDLDGLILEWTREDLRQDYVFLFRDGRPLDDSQHPHFRNRVQLSDPTLFSGDLTLKLPHVGHTDTGTYHCHIFVPSRIRQKRSQLGRDPVRTVDLVVVNPESKKKDFHQTLQSGAIPFEAGIGPVATLFVALFLQMWE